MPTVALRFSPLAEHVRTARLVAVSVARRAGFGEGQLDEIRIAIGEACAQAVLPGDATVRVGLVDMQLCDDDDRLDVTVVRCDADGRPLAAPVSDGDPLSTALLEGMADSSSVGTGAHGLQLSWSLHGAAGAHRGSPQGVPLST